MPLKNKLFLSIFVLFILFDLILLVYIVFLNISSTTSSSQRINFINNDKNISLSMDLNNKQFNSYVNNLQIFNKDGVLDPEVGSLRTKMTIKKVNIYFEPEIQERIWVKTSQGAPYVSYSAYLTKDVNAELILKLNINYRDFPQPKDYINQIKGDIQYGILFFLTRYSSKEGPGNSWKNVSRDVGQYIQNNKPDFVSVEIEK